MRQLCEATPRAILRDTRESITKKLRSTLPHQEVVNLAHQHPTSLREVTTYVLR